MNNIIHAQFARLSSAGARNAILSKESFLNYLDNVYAVIRTAAAKGKLGVEISFVNNAVKDIPLDVLIVILGKHLISSGYKIELRFTQIRRRTLMHIFWGDLEEKVNV